MGALAGDPRANAHYMELHKEELARRATSYVFAHEYTYAA
jgi:predicted AAA+ superfamily ATPase